MLFTIIFYFLNSLNYRLTKLAQQFIGFQYFGILASFLAFMNKDSYINNWISITTPQFFKFFCKSAGFYTKQYITVFQQLPLSEEQQPSERPFSLHSFHFSVIWKEAPPSPYGRDIHLSGVNEAFFKESSF